MKNILKILTLLAITTCALCTVDGISYMDPLNFKNYQNNWPRGEDPCNPLYWYPRDIPEYCYLRNATFYPDRKQPEPQPPLVPIPVPVSPPLPPPIPFPLPPPILPIPVHPPPPALPVPPPLPAPIPMPFLPMPGPIPIVPSPSLPYGVPILPTNPMVPVGGIPYPYLPPYPNYSMYRPPTQIGMVPGVPGLVSPGGGINILPFSDVYSDLLEKHKQKTINKRIKNIMNRYDGYPISGYTVHRSYVRHGKHNTH